MTDAATIRVDPRDYRLDGRLARRIWKLAEPYWMQRAHWGSWALLLFGFLIGPAWAYYNYRVAHIAADQANALVARDGRQWYALFWLIFLLGLGQWFYGVLIDLLNTLMRMHWYRWMTDWMIGRYLGSKTYYDIALKGDIDNPDERIQTNVEPFVRVMLDLPTRIMGTFLGILTNGLLITQVSSTMAAFVILYSSCVLVLQVVINLPLIRKNADLAVANADFRFGLLRVRDNAETIAFFRGEDMEERQVHGRVRRVVRKTMDIYYYKVWTGFLTRGLEDIWTIAPLVLIYPLYFKGDITFGAVAIATGAAMQMRELIGQLQQYIPSMTSIAPSVVRLSHIVERFDALNAAAAGVNAQLRITRDARIELLDVSFETPGGEQKLAQNVSLSVEPGQSLVIIGPTGVGKSSILRTMAGLWPIRAGAIVMPRTEDLMFVPQRPYMMLGDLRAQLLYPHGRLGMTDQDLQAVLERVCLPDLIEKAGGLDAQRDWNKILSLGEQQRVSFARILISRPGFVFLDESTSAVDIPTEALLYELLMEAGVTFVSVGHRETILRFHDRALRLHVGGAWDVVHAGGLEVTAVEPLGAARENRRAGSDARAPISVRT